MVVRRGNLVNKGVFSQGVRKSCDRLILCAAAIFLACLGRLGRRFELLVEVCIHVAFPEAMALCTDFP